MYGLDKSEDISFFVGSELQQICVSTTVIILKFNRGISLSLYGYFYVLKSNGNTIRSSGEVDDVLHLLPFLLKTIVSAAATDKRGLRLEFNKGGVIEIIDDCIEYESFVIQRGDGIIVV